MSEIALERNVQFLYEGHLAQLELRSFGCDFSRRDDDDPRLLLADLNGNLAAVHHRSAYVGAIDGEETVYAQLIRPAYQGGRFNRTRSVNQYLTHWIYPYRGKFHPQMVRALFNILGGKPGALAWEPFLGSGTAALEASLLGIDCIGTDLSPLCAMLARVKVRSVQVLDELRGRVQKLLTKPTLDMDEAEPLPAGDERVAEFLKIARMVTLSDVSRRGRKAEAAFRKNLTHMLESVEAHAQALADFRITSGRVDARVGDSRDLTTIGITPGSIDVIVTSPPYSIALNYVKNDEHALDALGVDMGALSDTMTGVRGRGAERLALYNEDMKRVFGEVAKALKPGGAAAFVVGDATIDRREVTTTDMMANWAQAAGLTRERNIRKIVFGLYNVMNDERILVFRK